MLRKRLATSNLPLTEIALEAVRKIHQPLLLYGIVVTVLLIIPLVIGQEVPKGLLPIVYALCAVVVLVALTHFYLQCRSLAAPDREHASLFEPYQRIYRSSDSTEFVASAEAKMRQAGKLIFMGTGLNILAREVLTSDIMSRAAMGKCQLEIFLADPTSPAVESRLIEEELGELKPPVGRPGMMQRLDTLLRHRDELGRPESIQINLFASYPTFALLIMDTEYFVYPYGYARLGNFSPVLQFSENNPSHVDVIAFLNEQYRRIKAISRSAENVIGGRVQKASAVENFCAFALYFVPSEQCALYQFGNRVLGFDVRRQRVLKSPWARFVGPASQFGFHLTVCDVLYFDNATMLKHIYAEVEFLAAQFRPFELSNLRLQGGFPDSKSCSVVMTDDTGSLEALHHELVHRVYRRAAASNYTTGLANFARENNPQRSALMIDRYGAPYILGSFVPHFTLLTQISPDMQSQVIGELERAFEDAVSQRSLHVDKLAIMALSKPSGRWTIAKEIILR